MNILDTLKKSVVEQFDMSISTVDIILSLLVATALAFLIILIYRNTFSGIVYNKNTALTILLITLTTALIIRTINSNLSLSLGMVGALSIVRFRTAIKDSVDTAFIFWAVTAGIMSGAGLYFLAIVGSLGIALIYYLAYYFNIKSKKAYLLIISFDQNEELKVESILSGIKKNLKNKNYSSGIAEVTYMVDYGKDLQKAITELNGLSGIKNVNLLAYSNDSSMQ